jgi:LPS O-antigen subunit length determinant protein (WzzB/FepE family)
MKPEVNAVLAEVKQSLAQAHQPAPLMPDFKAMSIMEATKWCIENGITSPKVISETTGKGVNTINTALWKIRNPKRVKMLSRRAKKVKELKIMLIKDATKGKAKVAKMAKVAKPKITNGLYDDGMETPFLDAIQRHGVFPDFVKPRSLEIADESFGGVHYLKDEVDRLRKEVQRLTIIVEYYEGKAGK